MNLSGMSLVRLSAIFDPLIVPFTRCPSDYQPLTSPLNLARSLGYAAFPSRSNYIDILHLEACSYTSASHKSITTLEEIPNICTLEGSGSALVQTSAVYT
jgi:hypothetical protein